MLALRLLSAEVKTWDLGQHYPSADILWHRGQGEVHMDLWNGWVRIAANPLLQKQQNWMELSKKKRLKDSGNWLKTYKLKNIYQENLLKFYKSIRSLCHFPWSSKAHLDPQILGTKVLGHLCQKSGSSSSWGDWLYMEHSIGNDMCRGINGNNNDPTGKQ